MGANRMAAVCQELETQAFSAEISTLGNLLLELGQAFQQFKTTVQTKV
jgi:hypothetical protein